MGFVSPTLGVSTLLLVINDKTETFTGSVEEEFLSLIHSLEIQNTSLHKLNLRAINPKHLLGSGQVADIAELINSKQIKQIITSLDLDARHQKGLNQELKVPIFDRTALILELFAHRARTYEGKIQVDMAQMDYAASRLVRVWTHLERQRSGGSGAGLRGGPGEKQLELDKRLIRAQIKQLKKKLDKMKAQRMLSRSARKKASLPTVSLVGYTNAGKSTLFNLLTTANAYASSKIFATLDPTVRKVTGERSFLLADTVGFIESLSKGLLQSFSATFGEINESDIILHMVDINDPKLEAKKQAVNLLLKRLDADTIPTIMVYNKIDMISLSFPGVVYNNEGFPESIWVSANKGSNITTLINHIRLAIASNSSKGGYNISTDADTLPESPSTLENQDMENIRRVSGITP